MELTHKILRDRREFETLFRNPKHARQMWSQTVIDRYTKPAMKPIAISDKDGQLTPTSQIELAVWEHLKAEIEASGVDRLPTEGEMMEACQAYYSRHNSASYVARRDSMGAKPIDETKQTITMHNPLEDLTDEELLAMQNALDECRQKEMLKEAEVEATTDTTTEALGDAKEASK